MLTTRTLTFSYVSVVNIAFYDFCGFRSVAVNSVYINCSFFTFISIMPVDYVSRRRPAASRFIEQGKAVGKVCCRGLWDTPTVLSLLIHSLVVRSAVTDVTVNQPFLCTVRQRLTSNSSCSAAAHS